MLVIGVDHGGGGSGLVVYPQHSSFWPWIAPTKNLQKAVSNSFALPQQCLPYLIFLEIIHLIINIC